LQIEPECQIRLSADDVSERIGKGYRLRSADRSVRISSAAVVREAQRRRTPRFGIRRIARESQRSKAAVVREIRLIIARIAAVTDGRVVIDSCLEAVAPTDGCTNTTACRRIPELAEIRKAVGISVLVLLVERQPVFIGERRRNAHADALAVVRRVRNQPEILYQKIVVSGSREILQQRLRGRTDPRRRNDISRELDAGIQWIVDCCRLAQVIEISREDLCGGNGGK